MPKFAVTVNVTRTVEYSGEIEVTAKDDDSARAKAEAQVEKIQTDYSKDIVKELDLEETNSDDVVEYDANQVEE